MYTVGLLYIDIAVSSSLMQTRRSLPICLAKKWFDSIFREFLLFDGYLTLIPLGFQLKAAILLHMQHKDNTNYSAMHLLLLEIGCYLFTSRRKIC